VLLGGGYGENINGMLMHKSSSACFTRFLHLFHGLATVQITKWDTNHPGRLFPNEKMVGVAGDKNDSRGLEGQLACR
jgi:hypothetical protein